MTNPIDRIAEKLKSNSTEVKIFKDNLKISDDGLSAYFVKQYGEQQDDTSRYLERRFGVLRHIYRWKYSFTKIDGEDRVSITPPERPKTAPKAKPTDGVIKRALAILETPHEVWKKLTPQDLLTVQVPALGTNDHWQSAPDPVILKNIQQLRTAGWDVQVLFNGLSVFSNGPTVEGWLVSAPNLVPKKEPESIKEALHQVFENDQLSNTWIDAGDFQPTYVKWSQKSSSGTLSSAMQARGRLQALGWIATVVNDGDQLVLYPPQGLIKRSA